MQEAQLRPWVVVSSSTYCVIYLSFHTRNHDFPFTISSQVGPFHNISTAILDYCFLSLSPLTYAAHSWLLQPSFSLSRHLPLLSCSISPLNLLFSFSEAHRILLIPCFSCIVCNFDFSEWGETAKFGKMRRGVVPSFRVCAFIALLLLLCVHESCCLLGYSKSSKLEARRADALLPQLSPTSSPQPFLPLLAPSPLTPFTNATIPKLSGLCPLNFTALTNMMIVTSTDCMAAFAPVLANVVCCPQVEATLVILIGQSSKYTNTLALNGSLASHCLSDFQQILVGQGANDSLPKICSVHSSNLTEGSCPVSDVAEFESTVDTSNLVSVCGKIDTVNECCQQICQNAILDAARKLAQKAYNLLSMDGSHTLSDHTNRINDCKSIVLRWLGSRLEPSQAKEVLRGLSNCRINKVCPLNFPNMSRVIKGCGSENGNQTACCHAVESYVSHLQRQSFVTNLQALNCAASFGAKLRKANITKNVYSQCHISLKDFSLQVGTQESGCLLPSLPSDVVFDQSAGISFLCDLNDNIPAPWPASQLPPSSCNKTVKIPALPAAASGQSRFHGADVHSLLCLMTCAALLILM